MHLREEFLFKVGQLAYSPCRWNGIHTLKEPQGATAPLQGGRHRTEGHGSEKVTKHRLCVTIINVCGRRYQGPRR